MTLNRIQPGPGQESVWDYPRPPRIEESGACVSVHFHGRTIAATRRAKRILEMSLAPVYMIPPEDVRMEYLRPSTRTTFCEWKGTASYFDLLVDSRESRAAAWGYPSPTDAFAAIMGYLSFYAQKVDECFVDSERVQPPPGRYYGGWITHNIIGPFKE